MKRTNRIASIAMASAILSCSAMGCSAAKFEKCKSDLAACQAEPKGQLPRTGQATCYGASGTSIPCAGTGQDGEMQRGLVRSYVDNSDGTVTDLHTGLIWEKKSDDGSIHDQDDTYTWTDAFKVFIAGLNSGSGFAGHTDWRLPNINELHSLADYGVPSVPWCVNPPVNAVFNTACTPGCSVTSCSCTPYLFAHYWSSTSYTDPPGEAAWNMLFWCGGHTGSQQLTQKLCARGVRGGP